jgi:hypothetical protein
MVITNRIAAALHFLVAICCSNAKAFIPKMRVLPLKEQEESYKCEAGLKQLFSRSNIRLASARSDRQLQYPEQYPATHDLSDYILSLDDTDAILVRPLLK